MEQPPKRIMILLAVISLFGAPPDAPRSTVSIVGATAAQRALAEWAVDRFAVAELRLPDVIIIFPGSEQRGCGGAPAITQFDMVPTRVSVCWTSELIMLHELAHVWEVHTLSPSARRPFMAMRQGVHSWADGDDEWEERGREHAANVIAWGLLENPYPIARTYPNDRESLMAAFRFLTGSEPLHDGGPEVQLVDRSRFSAGSNRPIESGR